MSMLIAWQVRDSERTIFVHKFLPQVFKAARTSGDRDQFFMALVAEILHVLRMGYTLGSRLDPAYGVTRKLLQDFLQEVNTFARWQAEVPILLMLLKEKVEPHAFKHFWKEYAGATSEYSFKVIEDKIATSQPHDAAQ
jgi:hypothetical protein